ncbi:TWO-COMPONENT RESPONSE REGULATOR 24 [Salix koriyanagi]|uniref:TWO-COMPONENT RESPONSE REGULATOR 24 n=1 Tax=Salix koriyanagi TaxID=2511006 RepID=A0A9Q0PVR5_9ROSI|nr:TWO-COMPONENT RESPONSE REGULATOR 24 [Salix koriyanagi]
MDGTYQTLIDREISCILERLSLCLGNFSQRMNESPEARREVIQIIREGASKTSQESSTHMSMADETSHVYYSLESTVAELNDYITETGRKMIASATVFTEGMEELKKNREESLKLFKRSDEHSATGFDQSAAPGREQDVLGLGNGSEEDIEGIDIRHFHVHRSRKEQKPGREEAKSSSEDSSSTATDKFSVLLVEYDTLDRLFNNTQIIEFGREYNLGMEVKVAKSGEKAILLHSQGASFDLILMDMDMPARLTTGYQATIQLRSLFGVKSNIVGLTYTTESEEITEFIRAGHLNGCIGKPLSDEKIGSLIPLQKAINWPTAGRQRSARSLNFMI